MIKDDIPNWFAKAHKDAADYSLDDGEIIWWGGIFSGLWEFGEWHSGKFAKGLWLDGYWYGGQWEDSIWVAGKWKNGRIQKITTHQPPILCEYIRSDVSPKCFFKPSKTISIKGIYS